MKKAKLKRKILKIEEQLKSRDKQLTALKKDLYQIIDEPESEKTKILIEFIKKRREFRKSMIKCFFFGDATKVKTEQNS